MLEREKQVAFAALDQKEQRLAVFGFFDGGAIKVPLARLPTALRPESERYNSGFFIKHKRECMHLTRSQQLDDISSDFVP